MCSPSPVKELEALHRLLSCRGGQAVRGPFHLSMDWYTLLLSCCLLTHCLGYFSFLSVFSLCNPWTANYPCISNPSSLILRSCVLCTFSQSFFTTWQFWCLSQGYELDHIKIISNTKNLNSHTPGSLGPVSSHKFGKSFWPRYLIIYSSSLWLYIYFFFSDI